MGRIEEMDAEHRYWGGGTYCKYCWTTWPCDARVALDEMARLRGAIEDHIAWAQGVTRDGSTFYPEFTFSDVDGLVDALEPAEGA